MTAGETDDVVADEQSPYVGLRSFGPQDAHRFHGRDRLLARLTKAVREQRLVVVVGASGAGKSSLLRAGLVAHGRPVSVRTLAAQLWPDKLPGRVAGTIHTYVARLDRDVVPALTETWFAATERRIDLELATGRAAQLVGELERMVTSYPTRESVWLRLMTALHRAGRRTDALAAYRRARATLNDEVGLEPGEELVQPHHTLLAAGEVPRRPDPRVP